MGIEIDGEYYSFWRNEPPQSSEDEDSLEVGLDHANTEHEGTDTMRAKKEGGIPPMGLRSLRDTVFGRRFNIIRSIQETLLFHRR